MDNQEQEIRFDAGPTESGRRLDSVLKDAAALAELGLSREAMKKIIREGNCRVNDHPESSPSRKIKAGDHIAVTLPQADTALVPEKGEVTVLYEDGDLLVVNKPAGLTVHPCPSCPSGTLIQRLASRYPGLLAMEGLRPGIVHRIDKDTSGLLIVALNESARLALSRNFAERSIHKEYLAVVAGNPTEEGVCDEPVGRNPDRPTAMAIVPKNRGGREAHTRFRRLWTDALGRASLVRVRIFTGRTHQIRVHMASLGHPLLGDAVYGRGGTETMASRQMLHAWKLTFTHPRTGQELSFTCPPPEDMRTCVRNLARQTVSLVVTGNPGSGKSTVTALLEQTGIPTVSADALVSSYYAKGGVITEALVRRIGEDILENDGTLNRTMLMKAFQASPVLRQDVEQMAHTMVRGDIQECFSKAVRNGVPFVCAEIPLFFECGWNRDGFTPAPLVIGVHAGSEERSKRLATTRSWTADKIASIESWQWPEDKKMSRCDIVVENSGTREELEQQVQDILLPSIKREYAARSALTDPVFSLIWP